VPTAALNFDATSAFAFYSLNWFCVEVVHDWRIETVQLCCQS